MKDYWCTRKKGSVHMSITIAELKNRNKDSYQLIDIRDAIEISHGAVPDAVMVSAEDIETSSEVDKDKLLVIFCARGVVSIDVAEHLKEKGYQAESLEGGYAAWLLDVMSKPEEQNKAKDVELSLRKKFKKSIWSKFTKAINTYELVKPGDKIAVCISGGKDSMLMAKCFQELKLHNKFEFEVKFLVMDPGYSEANRKVIEENAKKASINIIRTKLADAQNQDYGQKFQRVLCDVPCSGFGIIRRKPELRYKSVTGLDTLPDLQYLILCNAARFVADGGTLVYSTCTLNPNENGKNAERFLKEHNDFKPYDIKLDNIIKGIDEPDNQLTLFPHTNGTDGFFISAFVRK